MASSRYLGEEIATTETVSYKKEFAWKIENWRDWWTSMDIDEITLSKTSHRGIFVKKLLTTYFRLNFLSLTFLVPDHNWTMETIGPL